MKYNKPTDIPALTGVRFVAVSMVFLIHYVYKLQHFGGLTVGIVNQFYLSLHIFFVLSGFLICYRYYEKVAFNKNFLAGYFLKRFARVYPLYFIFTTLFFLDWYARSLGGKHLWEVYLLNITFIRGFSSKFLVSGVFPAWSLTVEETFYILSPIIFMLIKKKNIIFPQVVFFWLVGGLLLYIFRLYPFEGFFSDFHLVFFATFFGRCFEFFAGIWLAVFLKRNDPELASPPRFSKPVFTYVGILTMSVIIFILYKLQVGFGLTIGENLLPLLISNLAFPIGIVLFFYGLIKESSKVKSLLSTRFFQIMGRSSYAFFLIHTGVIAAYIENYISGNLLLMYIFLQLLSVAVYTWLEHPLDSWIRTKGNNLIKKW